MFSRKILMNKPFQPYPIQANQRAWDYWYPEDGETEDDGNTIMLPGMYTAKDVAQQICELDYNNRCGWERGMGTNFHFIIRSDDGVLSQWIGTHEQSLYHNVRIKED